MSTIKGGIVVVLLVTLMQQGAHANLEPPERSYEILMLLPSCSRSHRNVFMPLATALTERGHKVTMLNMWPPADDNPNITYIDHGLRYFDGNALNMFEVADHEDEMFQEFKILFSTIARELYEVPVVRELYSKRHQFDLMIVNSLFNEAAYPFVHNQTYITVGTAGLTSDHSAAMGNVLNPAYFPNFATEFSQPYSMFDRFKNLFLTITVPLMWKSGIQTPTQIEISKLFPDLPSLDDLIKNESLTLLNTHHSIGMPLPLLPNQVEVGGMHVRPAKPLPKDIDDFLSGTTPVVYMSLGSIARSSTMPPEYMEITLSTFSKLQYKVLWKYEEELENLSKNVFIKKWMPQQDVLAHPNVKVFISHCGLLGSQEAIYHRTPILGLPLFGDQHKNAKTWENAGIGIYLKWKSLTVELLTSTIQELITNPKYKENIDGMSAHFRDLPMSPVETAVYWTEYVIRHRGAGHLRSPSMNLTWVEFFYLDLILMLYLALYVTYRLVKKAASLCFPAKPKVTKKGKNKKE
ncbi:UDP-glucuronosyl/UDP-glucosyltransferase [Trinorchestia longiramus]|nr:UDP-glucuronosyl/UDP-glucosyltransferase [Trinorchestia longiramus]